MGIWRFQWAVSSSSGTGAGRAWTLGADQPVGRDISNGDEVKEAKVYTYLRRFYLPSSSFYLTKLKAGLF
jgi:hypothetical protein